MSEPKILAQVMQPAYYPENLLEQVKTCQVVLIGRESAIGGDAA